MANEVVKILAPLVRLDEEIATFEVDEVQWSIEMPLVAWVALGRPGEVAVEVTAGSGPHAMVLP